ncbi:cation:proton antiporter [Actinosynnema sp. NPDC047251]|uniref:Cation/H+ antiporter n=1 Tax=Saccharothrix espanaensis (strain ATCC 51144 / DSM 44229 / JCM 9112 / NBRC 15066 / NRRL 15764) TaxID=1179773 RepID=K0JWZ1_SACES|nr:cation:proton antiporter [Saccharothrix espanaensis]CCH30556.1 Cation/H+ antiporter [Saccharothrix espanaensis DSM 44229]
MSDLLVRVGHVAAVLAVVLVAAYLGRRAARAARQPEVIGEILAGILVVPAVLAIGGPDGLARVLPGDVVGPLKTLGQVGLVLFLVGVAHELRHGKSGLGAKAVGWVTAGSFVPALLAGLGMAAWVLLAADPDLRGTAPAPALVLMVAVALSVTAVPVLARILEDRRMVDSPSGKLSMAAAVVTDSVAWVLLVVAVGISGGVLVSLALLAVGVAVTVVGRILLRGKTPMAAAERFPKSTGLAVSALALLLAFQFEHWGLTAVFGAFVVGLALPAGPWTTVVRPVTNLGRLLVPVFFVVAGMGVANAPRAAVPWAAILIALALAVVGKIGGGYLGTRLAGQDRRTALTVGVLMNTRGLTEIVVLQAGYSAGLLSVQLFLALVVMALVTTAMTGPLLSLIERRARVSAAATRELVPDLPGGRP